MTEPGLNFSLMAKWKGCDNCNAPTSSVALSVFSGVCRDCWIEMTNQKEEKECATKSKKKGNGTDVKAARKS